MIRSFRDLRVWQLGIELVEETYRITGRFPRSEAYGLSSQMQRAAVSIPSNVAEGHSRESTREYLRHVSIAQGSLAELETQIVIAQRLGYCPAEAARTQHAHIEDLGRQLYALRDALRRRLTRDGHSQLREPESPSFDPSLQAPVPNPWPLAPSPWPLRHD